MIQKYNGQWVVVVGFKSVQDAEDFENGLDDHDAPMILSALRDGEGTVLNHVRVKSVHEPDNVNSVVGSVTGTVMQVNQVKGEVIDHSTVVRRRT